MGKRILKTKLCDMLGIEYPILSAGMGPTLIGEKTGAPVELVVAVSEAGGLGVLGGSGFTVDGLREAARLDPGNLRFHRRLLALLATLPGGAARGREHLDRLPAALADSLRRERGWAPGSSNE